MSFETTRAVCLIRAGGMGDVLMVLAAAKALKVLFGCPVLVGTSAKYRRLAEACPHVDAVFSNNESFQAAIAHYPAGPLRAAHLDAASFGIAKSHQIDAYLDAFGVQAPPNLKQIELRSDPLAETQVENLLGTWPSCTSARARILIHPGKGDPNRTWPRVRWEELAATLISEGHQVIAIGHHSAIPNRSVQDLGVDNLLIAVDGLDALGTIALMRRSHVLICVDGGPVQLAGATDIGIVGLYSVVAAANRLPFRHGEAGWRAIGLTPTCMAYPCYQLMHDPVVAARVNKSVQEEHLNAPTVFSDWCVMQERYRCMTQEITVRQVRDACWNLLREFGYSRH